MAVIMIENDKKDNEDERKYKKSQGTTLTSWRPFNLECSQHMFQCFKPLLKVCILSQLDERWSDDDGGDEGETGAALSGTIC